MRYLLTFHFKVDLYCVCSMNILHQQREGSHVLRGQLVDDEAAGVAVVLTLYLTHLGGILPLYRRWI